MASFLQVLFGLLAIFVFSANAKFSCLSQQPHTPAPSPPHAIPSFWGWLFFQVCLCDSNPWLMPAVSAGFTLCYLLRQS